MRTLLTVICVLCLAASVNAEEVTLASVPPVVVTTIPMAGSVNVDPSSTEIRVTYSKKMMNGSWSFSTMTEESFPKIEGQPRYESDEKTCVLNVVLEPNKTYAIWANSSKFRNFKDTAGIAALPYLLVFQTGPSIAK